MNEWKNQNKIYGGMGLSSVLKYEVIYEHPIFNVSNSLLLLYSFSCPWNINDINHEVGLLFDVSLLSKLF